MKKLFLVANWKSNKTLSEADSFMSAFLNKEFISWLHTKSVDAESKKQVVLCPPSFLLSNMSAKLQHLNTAIPVSLGAQNISPFEEGPHTGEESANQLAEFAQFVIIGHSERRQELGETDEIVAQKVVAARKAGLEPIVCVQGKNTPVPENVHIVAYEPLDAISTGGVGQPLLPEQAEETALFFKHERHIPYVLYGGSVTSENVHSYTVQPAINGVLVGGASLIPEEFSRIVQRA